MESVYSIQYICLLMTTTVVFIAGLLIHSFIVAVNIIDCWKRRALTSADQILFSVGFSRLIFQVLCMADMSFTKLQQSIFNITVIHAVSKSLLNVSNYSSIWFSTLLSIMFCLNMFHNASFVWLRSFIVGKVVHLIFTCILLACVYTAVGSWWYHNDLVSLDIKLKMNVTQLFQLSLHFEIYYLIGNVVPFVLNCISTIIVLRSLLNHLSRMRGNDNIATHLDAYYTAIKCTVSCFVSYTLHVICNLIVMNYILLMDIVAVFCITNVFPALHSAYLIYITTRLRNQFSRLVYYGRKCLFNGERFSQIASFSDQNQPGVSDPHRRCENISMR